MSRHTAAAVAIAAVCLSLLARLPLRWLAAWFIVLPATVFGLSLSLGLGASYLLALRRAQRAHSRIEPAVLAFTGRAAWARTQTKHAWACAPSTESKQSLHPSVSPSLTVSIDALFDLIMRHFVLKWYRPLTSHQASNAFPAAVEKLIRHALAQALQRVDKVDWPTLIVQKILPKVTRHLELFKAAGGRVSGEEMDLLVASKYAALLKADGQRGALHEAVNVASLESRPAEEKWLRPRVESILRLLFLERYVNKL